MKATFGLTGNVGDNPPRYPYFNDMRAVVYPGGYFYGCGKAQCKARHALTTAVVGAPYMDGSEAQKGACRAFTPSWTPAIAAGTLKVGKIPKKTP